MVNGGWCHNLGGTDRAIVQVFKWDFDGRSLCRRSGKSHSSNVLQVEMTTSLDKDRSRDVLNLWCIQLDLSGDIGGGGQTVTI